MRFFVGLHQPSDAKHFDAAFVSVNRLRNRKSDFAVGDWIMDSGAFSTILTHGGYPHPVEEYAAHVRRWKTCGNLLAAVSQDYMCEPSMLAKTGLTIAEHQRLTIERYDALLRCETGCYIMPVLQGYAPEDYVAHIRQYGSRLAHGAWAGVGSVCKRNGDPKAILAVLSAIKMERPDLQLHGFGLKLIALAHGVIRALLATADSMAWSFAARRKGTGANDWRNAARFRDSIEVPRPYQGHLIEEWDVRGMITASALLQPALRTSGRRRRTSDSIRAAFAEVGVPKPDPPASPAAFSKDAMSLRNTAPSQQLAGCRPQPEKGLRRRACTHVASVRRSTCFSRSAKSQVVLPTSGHDRRCIQVRSFPQVSSAEAM